MASGDTIILLDDDDAVREAVSFALETHGYQVRAFAHPRDLPPIADLAAAACLIIDQVLPGETGLALLARLRDHAVKSPAILITTSPPPAMQEVADQLATVIVEKPLLGDRLFAVVDRLLAAS